jgi:hypothetical protein
LGITSLESGIHTRERGRKTKPYVPPEKFATLLGLIAEPYSTMVYIGHEGILAADQAIYYFGLTAIY